MRGREDEAASRLPCAKVWGTLADCRDFGRKLWIGLEGEGRGEVWLEERRETSTKVSGRVLGASSAETECRVRGVISAVRRPERVRSG